VKNNAACLSRVFHKCFQHLSAINLFLLLTISAEQIGIFYETFASFFEKRLGVAVIIEVLLEKSRVINGLQILSKPF